MSTERHLLFAVLAFENELIDLTQLTEACRGWAEDKSKPLAESLVERGWLTIEDRAFVEKAVDRKLAKHESDPLATLNEATRAEVSDALKDVEDTDIQATLSMPASGNPLRIETLGQTLPQSALPKTRYTWLSEVGKGGLGQVWLARDNELVREVALKEVKAGMSAASQQAMRRLIKEAQITGQLQHPNIVPVYEVNRGARPFYTMKLVRGETLTKAIRAHHERRKAGQLDPLSLPKLLNVFVKICEALAYAHSRGVIHRDLKPENIILGEYGEAIVLDWGLAKQVSSADEDSLPVVLTEEAASDQTRAGATPGTLPYMAPEQARGRVDQMDAQTDIYGLGAILFEILIGEPPHKLKETTNANGAAPSSGRPSRIDAYLKQISDEPSPIAKERDPSVHVVLNAICEKAMAYSKAQRYATAKDLAADVQRFLADEPVSVLREPLSIRAQRWMKNHRTLVATTAATLLIGSVSLGVLAAVMSRHATEVSEKNLQLQAANTKEREASTLATERAEIAREQSQLALATLNAVIFDLTNSLENVAGGAEVRNQLLSTALPQLKKVSSQFAEKSAVDRNTMYALIHLADTILILGQGSHDVAALDNATGDRTGKEVGNSPVEIAKGLYERAHEIGQQLATAAPDDENAKRDLSVSFSKLGEVFLRLGRTDVAHQHFEDGLKISRSLAESDPKDADKQRDLSILSSKLGDVLLKLGRTDEAVKLFEDSFQVRDTLLKANRSDVQRQRDVAASHDRLGTVFLKLGRTGDALREYENSLQLNRGVAQADPRDTQKQRDLAVSHSKLGDVFLRLGRQADALVQFETDLKISRELTTADPRDAQKQRDLAVACDRLGDLFLMLGRTDDAVTQLEDAAKIRRTLAQADPRDVQRQRDLFVSISKLGDVCLALGKTKEAVVQFEDALRRNRELVAADPSDIQQQRDLSISLERLGDVLLTLERMSEALQLFEESAKITRGLADADPRDAQKQRDLSLTHNKLGNVFIKLGRNAEAVQSFEAGLKIRRALAEADPRNADIQRDVMVSEYKLGEVQVELGNYDAAIERFQAGIAVLDKMIENQQLVELSQGQRLLLQKRIEACVLSKLVTGDWNSLLQVDPKSLPTFLSFRATLLAKRGRYQDVAQAAAKLRELEPKDKENLYNAACAYALAATAYSHSVSAQSEADPERDKLLALSLACLKEAIFAGYDNFSHIREDADLTPLRGRPEFETLLGPKKE